MQNIKDDVCPMPEPFRKKIGITLFLGWLFYLSFVARVIFAPLMPAIEADLGISHSRSGSLFLMISFGYLLAPFCSGLVSSRINHRGTLAVSAWIVGLVLMLFLFVGNVWSVSLLLILIGAVSGMHLPSAVATIAAEVQKSDLGKAMSIHQVAPPLSFVSAPIISALLLDHISWRHILMIWAIISLVSAFLYSLRGKGGDFPGQTTNPENIKSIMSIPAFWIMVLLFAMAIGGTAGIYSMLPLFLVNERSMDLAAANTLIGFSQVTGLVIIFFSGWLTDKAGQKRMIALSLLGAGLFTILLGILKGYWLIVMIFIQPALVTSFFPGAFAALSYVAPPSIRSVTSALGPPVSFLMGGGLLPLIIGYLGETISFSAGIILAGCFMLAGPVLIKFLNLGKYDDETGC